MDLSTATAIRDELITAYRSGKQIGSYMIEGRSVTYRSLSELRMEIQYWDRTIAELNADAAGVSRVTTAIFRASR